MARQRRTARRAAARTQVCACIACCAFLCQAVAFFCYFRGTRPLSSGASPPTATPLPPPPPPSPPPAFSTIIPTSTLADIPLSVGAKPPARIAQLIHQSWRDGGFPKGLFNWRWQQGLLDLNPGWKLMKWTDESSRALIAQDYPWFLSTYDAYPSYIQRCDAARYFILYHYGGVYADLDIECSRRFRVVAYTHTWMHV